MPEGHSIHRYARLHRALLGGHTVAASSPQGRFAAGAGMLDGTTLLDVEAHGKHLFYRFSGLAVALHVHLGLVGVFRQYERDPIAPRPATRLALAANGSAVHLSGPAACELIDPEVEAALRNRLGPDPLRGDDPSRAFAALSRRSAAIGQVLLDQEALAGVGNVYRAEVLFLMGVHPDRPACNVDQAVFYRMWRLLCTLMTDGERRGRIVTVPDAEDTGEPEAEGEHPDVFVYRRAGLPCRRCGHLIRSWKLAGRLIFACPHCQPS
jgi:formamidopyrimidine-DNA glycosylase